MVTIPPRDGAPTEPDAAERFLSGAGTEFGGEAERYDRSRPDYPEAMVEAVIAASPGPRVLDVGVGTGIAARLFAAKGCEVLGVEVDARMAAVARRHGVETEVARFEDWDAAGRRFDTLVAAQTWHWIDPVAGAAKAAEVLRPNGRLALCWNVFEPPPEVAAVFAKVHGEVLPESVPNFWARPPQAGYDLLVPRIEAGIRESGAFGEPERWRYPWERRYTTAAWLDQMPTSGGFGRLGADLMRRVLDRTGAALDELGGAFTMGYTTLVITAAVAAR